MNYKHQIAWKKIESKLPEKFHFTEEYQLMLLLKTKMLKVLLV